MPCCYLVIRRSVASVARIRWKLNIQNLDAKGNFARFAALKMTQVWKTTPILCMPSNIRTPRRSKRFEKCHEQPSYSQLPVACAVGYFYCIKCLLDNKRCILGLRVYVLHAPWFIDSATTHWQYLTGITIIIFESCHRAQMEKFTSLFLKMYSSRDDQTHRRSIAMERYKIWR